MKLTEFPQGLGRRMSASDPHWERGSLAAEWVTAWLNLYFPTGGLSNSNGLFGCWAPTLPGAMSALT